MKTIFLTTIALAVMAAPVLAQTPGLWDHNGSAMRLVHHDGGFGLYYEGVRPGLVQTVPPGAPRFDGQRNGNQIVGNAFVHTKYCPGISFPYPVYGVIIDEVIIELYGPAAVVDPRTCSIVGFKPDSDNAHVVFRIVQLDDAPGALPLAPAPQIAPRKMNADQEAEALMQQGREFCRRYPRHQVCNNGGNQNR